ARGDHHDQGGSLHARAAGRAGARHAGRDHLRQGDAEAQGRRAPHARGGRRPRLGGRRPPAGARGRGRAAPPPRRGGGSLAAGLQLRLRAGARAGQRPRHAPVARGLHRRLHRVAPRVDPRGLGLLAVVVLCWGLTWPVNKVILASLPPIWTVAIRSAIGAGALLALSLALGRLRRPPRADVPVLLSLALLHVVGFGVLASIGLGLVPTGRSVLLAYTTPLWVMPGAALFLGERLTPLHVAGVAAGLLGLAVLLNPLALDWTSRE